jgi:cytochrome P450
LTDEEILSFTRVLLPAGAETTTRGLGSLLAGLLNDPEQLDLLRNNRGLLLAAIDEALRWEAPTQFTYRLTTEDTEAAGVKIPAGSGINLCIAAANHDPARWQDPHRFDIRRKPSANLAFGFGVHVCIGMHLARTEMALAMHAILDRLPNLRTAPGAAPPKVQGSTYRWPTTLPVIWDN